MKIDTTKTDVLVVGGGAAGIMAAVRARDKGADVLLLTNGALGKDSAVTWMTGGGFQCALYPPDSPEIHARDTVINGSYINNQELVRAVLEEGPRCIFDLDEWGERFWKDGKRFIQDFMPGHSHARCVVMEKTKSTGEIKGYEHRRVLPYQVRQKKIPVLEDFTALDLLTADNRVVGVIGLDVPSGEFKVIAAKTVILATGGYASCFKHSLTGPSVIGWGIGMAYRAGARFIDMEMIDFYPYCAVWPKLRCVNIWAANLRYGLSGKFMNRSGFEFFNGYRKRGLTRAQSIYKEVEAGRGGLHDGIYLSFRHVPVNIIDEYLARSSSMVWYKQMMESGIDIRNEAVELFPMSMATLGGLVVDTRCRSTLPGLYAVGELIGGFDGAHTLAGNLMISCFASGSLAGDAAADEANDRHESAVNEEQVHGFRRQALYPMEHPGDTRSFQVKKAIQDIAWKYINISGRTREGLETAAREIEKIKLEKVPDVSTKARNRNFNREWSQCLELNNMITSIEMTVRGALTRTESRGLHFRDDYPGSDPNWTKNVVIRKAGDGMAVEVQAVEFPYFQPKERGQH